VHANYQEELNLVQVPNPFGASRGIMKPINSSVPGRRAPSVMFPSFCRGDHAKQQVEAAPFETNVPVHLEVGWTVPAARRIWRHG